MLLPVLLLHDSPIGKLSQLQPPCKKVDVYFSVSKTPIPTATIKPGHAGPPVRQIDGCGQLAMLAQHTEV
jgi:hypothetical protein